MERTVQKIVANCDSFTFDYEPYLDMEVFAEKLVEATVITAALETQDLTEQSVLFMPPEIEKPSDVEYVEWPDISTFTVELCNNTIEEFCLHWSDLDNWMFCIDLISEASDECSTYYLFEVKWSSPSKAYPIPQAVASVFFTVDVSKIHPGECPIKVTYVFEGSRFTHIPGQVDFQSKWLCNIIDSKTMFYQSLTF